MTRNIALAVNPKSEETEKTIQWSLDNFFRSQDHIHLIIILIVDAEFDSLDPAMSVTESSVEDIRNEISENTAKEMQEIADRLKGEGFTVTNHLLYANASQACDVLVRHIDESSMDCLVLGRRELPGWKRFFLGSFSNHVQSSVHCPVLIVR